MTSCRLRLIQMPRCQSPAPKIPVLVSLSHYSHHACHQRSPNSRSERSRENGRRLADVQVHFFASMPYPLPITCFLPCSHNKQNQFFQKETIVFQFVLLSCLSWLHLLSLARCLHGVITLFQNSNCCVLMLCHTVTL